MALPDTCKGCPFYDPKKRMVPDAGASGEAQMHVILLAPTYQAERMGYPDTTEIQRGLRLSGIGDYSMGHMLRCRVPARPKGAAALVWDSKVAKAAKHCEQYTELPDLPIVTVGKHVWNHYCKEDEDIYNWRGFRY